MHAVSPRRAGRPVRDSWRDVVEGLGGAAQMAAELVRPGRRAARCRWGLSLVEAARPRLGDDLVPNPGWGWTHGITIDAPAEAVWPWVAQLGAERGGFASYQWLENLVGCRIRNADAIRPEWAVAQGDVFTIHPKAPPLLVVAVEPGRAFVVHGAPDRQAMLAGTPWMAASWLFAVEPLGPGRCRFVSRYRCATSEDLASRLGFGPALIEPIGFVMDRRMLRGIKARAEASHHAAGALP